MLTALDPLRQLNFASLLFRLALAMFFGGMIGMERERKRRPAGFRTYMLVCLGATLAAIVSQYNFIMLNTTFYETMKEVGRTTDVSRIGAKVIGGIGFLGAGTVIVTGRQEVKGLTTAAGLWASACMGLAIGLLRVRGAGIRADLPLHPSAAAPGEHDGGAGPEHESLCGVQLPGRCGRHHRPHQVPGRPDL